MSAATFASLLADRLDPPEPDAFAKLDYTPTPRQAEFHAATEFDILFGGSLGGGKSKAVTMHALQECVRYPGLRVGAFRRTYGELKESLIAELANCSFGRALGATWNGTEYELRFPNGSLIMFRYAESIVDATRRQGGAYQMLIFDERTLMAPDVVAFLESRVRSGRTDIPVLGVRSTANPGGPGHGAVRARYIDPTNYGEHTYRDVRGRMVRFIPSKMADNPYLNAEYRQDLKALPEHLRRAFEDGDWSVFAGMMFQELSRDRHVIAPITLPATWKRYNGVDWGYTKPWAVLWAAVDEDGRVWVYREIYKTQVGEAEQARMILGAEVAGENVSARFADDAMWATRGDAKPIADVYADNGVFLTQAGKGAGSRVIGWQRIHSYLGEAPACLHHRSLGWATCPLLHMFSTCEDLYRELSNLPHATTGDPEDADTKAPDHLCLAGSTLVETEQGAVRLERVRSGDRVWTRAGLRTVIAAGLTDRDAEVGTVELSSGAILRGTANHPVWVADKGWTRLDSLRYSDRIVTWQGLNASSLAAFPSVATRTLSEGLTGCTSRRRRLTVRVELVDFIKKFGRRPTDPFLMAITFTTRITTRSTTRWATWSASRARITSATTTPAETTVRRNGSNTWRRFAHWLPSGMGRPSAESGIATMADEPGMVALPPLLPANNAGPSTKAGLGRAATGFAPTIASIAPGWSLESTTRPATASCVAQPLESTSTSRSASVPVHVQREWLVDRERADVYNLTISGTHEFFANGALVHNCDSLRYLLTNLGSEPGWVFPSEVPAEALDGPPDPNAVDPAAAVPAVPNIGGFPILHGNSPWGAAY